MNEGTLLLLLVGAAVVGMVAVLLILRRTRLAAASGPDPDRPYAASTEGETRCPACGMGNLWTDESCVACGARLG
jgi:hypothetical protein